MGMSSSVLLKSKVGRLLTFFFLYMSEGLPHGFATVAVATEMRSQGVSPANVNWFVAIILLPWAWKWAIGPVVDVFYVDRLGRRRVWIVAAQSMMVLTLLAALPIDFNAQIMLFTGILLIHNIFSATQDVAIDALACGMLKEEERGLANGLMFGGAHLGALIGGAGSLYLAGFLSNYFPGEVAFKSTFLFVAGCILLITVLVSLRLKEPRTKREAKPEDGSDVARVTEEIGRYVSDAVRALFGTRAALLGMIFALLPVGAHALSTPLQTNLAVELGFDKTQIAHLMSVTGIVWIVGCVIGGLLSDVFGRRKMLALYCLGTIIPTIYLAVMMDRLGWIMPIDPKLADATALPEGLVVVFWTASLGFYLFNGLMYGTRTALFMDLTTPAVAATQFTAYMSLVNLTISYSMAWQGECVERLGYPITFTLDAALGLLCLLLLPWMTRTKASDELTAGG